MLHLSRTNGITVKCNGCSEGDTGYVGGVLHTAYDNTSIQTKSKSDTDWDRVVTTLVTSFYGLFRNDHGFNQDISSWDTSNVTNMGRMFLDARAFNQNIMTKRLHHTKINMKSFMLSIFGQLFIYPYNGR